MSTIAISIRTATSGFSIVSVVPPPNRRCASFVFVPDNQESGLKDIRDSSRLTVESRGRDPCAWTKQLTENPCADQRATAVRDVGGFGAGPLVIVNDVTSDCHKSLGWRSVILTDIGPEGALRT